MERFARPVSSVILIMLVQLHPEVSILSLLRQSAGKGLVGIKHLFHAGEGIHVQDFSLQLLQRQMYGSHTRNAIPVEPFLLPTARGGGYVLSRHRRQDLQTSMRQVAAIQIVAQIMFGCPKIAGMSASHSRPVAATLHGHAAVAERQVSLRIGFGTETFIDKQFRNLTFLRIRDLRHVFRSLLLRRRTGDKAQISGRHLLVELGLPVGSARHSHHRIVHRH